VDREVHAEVRADPNDLSRTIITNTYLNALEAETLSVFNSNEIRKNRYHFEFEGRKFSVDMFLGDLFGLVLAEVSFETDEELDNFPNRRSRSPTSPTSRCSAAATL
jgi:CYTH domain-containing protein